MAYIGRNPQVQKFSKVVLVPSTIDGRQEYELRINSETGDTISPIPTQCIFSLNDEILEPGVDFNINGANVVFSLQNPNLPSTSPRAGDLFFGVVIGDVYDAQVPESFTITSSSIQPGAVVESSILDGSVTEDKIATNAVTTNKILDSAVTTNKIVNNAVTSTKIATGAINSSSKLSGQVVLRTNIQDDAIDSSKIDANAVGTGQIQDRAVTSAKLDTNFPVITSNTYLADSVVESRNIRNNTIVGDDIALGTIEGDKLDPVTAGNGIGRRYVGFTFSAPASANNGDLFYVVTQ